MYSYHLSAILENISDKRFVECGGHKYPSSSFEPGVPQILFFRNLAKN